MQACCDWVKALVDGGHTMRVWEATVDEALAFLFAHLNRLSLARAHD
ncbi:hypothetical protein [Elioraea rosea]|nr:hypothetical protein [Elioraea rosea]